MTQREFIAQRLDVAAFATASASLAGATALADFSRLCDAAPAGDSVALAAPLRWQATGRTQARQGGEPELWIDLTIDATVPLICQRCLGPMLQPVALTRSFRFVADDASAAELDIDAEEDVLVASRRFDLLELIEDEVLLALPIVPKHDLCPANPALATWIAPAEETETTTEPLEPAKRQPFAVLASLKREPSGDD